MTSSKARLGSFDDLIAELPPNTASNIEPIARTLRALITAALADRRAALGVT